MHQTPSLKVIQFQLGPFEVQCYPNHYEIYTRYTILANGVPVRDQISFPEEDNGWQGLAFAKANHTLTEEQEQVLKKFRYYTQRILK